MVVCASVGVVVGASVIVGASVADGSLTSELSWFEQAMEQGWVQISWELRSFICCLSAIVLFGLWLIWGLSLFGLIRVGAVVVGNRKAGQRIHHTTESR